MKTLLFLLLFASTTLYSQQLLSVTKGVTANSFFDNNQGKPLLNTIAITDQVVSGLVDDETGEQVSFVKVTAYEDGSAMDLSKVDDVIYRKKSSFYYKRVYYGAVNVRWFGAKGDARTNDTKAIQKAVDLYNNVYIPNGKYLVAGIVIARKGVSLFGDGRDKSRMIAITNQEFVLALKNPKVATALMENEHIHDLMIDGGNKSKFGLYVDIVASIIERLDVVSCLEYGIFHHRGYTSNYRDCNISYCKMAGLNVYQEGNLLMFENCLFSNNQGSGILFYSGSTSIFLKCSIENNGGYGVLLTYQKDSAMAKLPYVQTATSLITFMSCFFEDNGAADHKQYANMTLIGEPDPGYLKLRNIVIKNCHFGLTAGERAIDIHSDIQNVTIEDNFFAYNTQGGITPVLLGSFYLNDLKRVGSGLVLRNNFFHRNNIEIADASALLSKNAIADLMGSVEKATINTNGVNFKIYKAGTTASVYINGTSTGKSEQNINISGTGIILTTNEKMSLANYEQNKFLFETRPLKEGNIVRFGCVAGYTFNNVVLIIPCEY